MKATVHLALALWLALYAGGAANAQTSAASTIVVEQPWARATPKGAKTGAAYMTLVNIGGSPDRLIGATTPLAGKVQFHKETEANSVSHMSEMQGMKIAKPDNVKDLSQFLTTTKPEAIRGQRLFTERRSAWHALDVTKFDPMLGGVVGRKAGSASGYNYSLALRGADLTWSADRLDRWLTDPRTFIAGTKMPVRVPDSSTRRDIIAYLALESRKPSDRTEDRSVVQGSLDQDSKE
jgi:cytochrome c2